MTEKPIEEKTVMEKLRDGDKLTQEDWDSLQVVWSEEEPLHGEHDGAFMRGMNSIWALGRSILGLVMPLAGLAMFFAIFTR